MSASPLSVVGLEAFLMKEYPRPEPILGEWLCRGEYVLLSGPSGVGKSLFATSIGLHLACGYDFLSWKVPRPMRVLLVDGEMSPGRLQERIRASLQHVFNRGAKQAEKFDVYCVESARADTGTTLLLSDAESMARLVKTAEDFDIVILDNFYCLYRGDENESRTWEAVNHLAAELKGLGKTAILIHHVPKSRVDAPSGHSMNERAPDTSLVMVRVDENDLNSAIRLKYRKLRHVQNPDGNLTVKFQHMPEEDGVPAESFWVLSNDYAASPEAKGHQELIVALKEQGLSTRQIEAEIRARFGDGPKKSTIAATLKHS